MKNIKITDGNKKEKFFDIENYSFIEIDSDSLPLSVYRIIIKNLSVNSSKPSNEKALIAKWSSDSNILKPINMILFSILSISYKRKSRYLVFMS